MTFSRIRPQTRRFSGYVMTAPGQFLQDVAVMLTGDSPSHHDIAALTDSLGRFVFDDLLPGIYNVLVNAEGYPSHIQRATVRAGETTHIEIVLPSEIRS